MRETADVVIIGGGVIGWAIAYHLSKRGVKVTLLERDEIGAHASGAAAGLFSYFKPMAKMDDYNRLLFASYALFPSLVTELEAATGRQLYFSQNGTLRTIHHTVRIERLRPWIAKCQALGLHIQLLSEAETRQREPLLAADTYGAVWLPDEGQVHALNYVKALAEATAKLGADIHPHQEVTKMQQRAGRVDSITTAQGETIACQQVVIATGAWAGECARLLSLQVPVVPQRGQLLALHQPVPPIRHTIIGKGIYVAPKQDNTVFIGSTNDDVGFDNSVTARGIYTLLEAAIRLVPALETCQFERAWAGLRPKTPDNKPIIGAIPGWENVLLAAGHYSFGVLLSAITGQAIADLVETGHLSDIVQPFCWREQHQ